jgi:hypothetical protein
MQEKAAAKLEAIGFGRWARRFDTRWPRAGFSLICKSVFLVINRYVIKDTLKKSLDISGKQE